MNDKYVLGFGGANADLHIRSRSKVLLHDSNPSVMSSSPGGVMRNILDNATRLCLDCRLLSSVGDDPNGAMLLESCRRQGIDVSAVLLSKSLPTCCYMDFLDCDGDMLVAANDMALMDAIPEDFLESRRELIEGASLLVVDSNPSEERLVQFCEMAGAPVFADPVSVAKGRKFRKLLSRLSLIKPNLMELEMLSGLKCENTADIRRAADKVLDSGCRAVAVSLGSRGCYYADCKGESFTMSLEPVESMINATGAGDAFMAGLVSGYMEGLNPEAMVARGLACGRLAVQCSTTINPNLSIDTITKELKHGLQKLY